MRFLCIRSRTSTNISANDIVSANVNTSEQPAEVPQDESNDPTIIQRIIYAPAALLGICAILVSLCAMAIMGGIVLILYIVEAIIALVLHMILCVKPYWSESIPILRPTIVEENITNIHIADIEIENKTNDITTVNSACYAVGVWSEPELKEPLGVGERPNSANEVEGVEQSEDKCSDILPIAIAITEV